MTEIAFSLSLILELIALFAIWSWSIRGRTLIALAAASLLVIAPLTIGLLLEQQLSARMYLVFGGMYIFTGLIWRWWKEGISPDHWTVSDMVLAIISAEMFSIANSASSWN